MQLWGVRHYRAVNHRFSPADTPRARFRMTLPPSIVVAPEGDSWSVKMEGAVVTMHPTEEEARKSARILARRLKQQDDDGTVSEKKD